MVLERLGSRFEGSTAELIFTWALKSFIVNHFSTLNLLWVSFCSSSCCYDAFGISILNHDSFSSTSSIIRYKDVSVSTPSVSIELLFELVLLFLTWRLVLTRTLISTCVLNRVFKFIIILGVMVIFFLIFIINIVLSILEGRSYLNTVCHELTWSYSYVMRIGRAQESFLFGWASQTRQRRVVWGNLWSIFSHSTWLCLVACHILSNTTWRKLLLLLSDCSVLTAFELRCHLKVLLGNHLPFLFMDWC